MRGPMRDPVRDPAWGPVGCEIGGVPVAPARFPLGAPGRPPTPEELAGIGAAVTMSELVAGIPDGVIVTVARVSRLRAEWAFVALRSARPGGTGPAVGVLRRYVDGWYLDQIGTFDLGRERVPPPVLAEFGMPLAP